jgi:hypothetical protein
MRRLILLTATVFALAACQSAPKDYIQFHAGMDSTTIGELIANNIAACWFAGKRKAFEGYSYAPESGASADRILIVPKQEPHGLPQLVVEVRKAKRGTDVRLFGPLMQTGEADSIRTDIRRWTGGARDC